MALKPKRITAKDVDGCGISIEIIKENKDGSADAQVTFSKQGLQTLVQWGVVAMLTAAIDEYRVVSEKSSKVATKRTRTATKKASKK
jgi:phage head maturation protease